MNYGNPEKVVVDANVLIHSRAQFPFQKALIPPNVREEIKSDMSQLKMQKLDIQVIKPSEASIEKVEDKSSQINSPTSKQDEEALALAIDRRALLITDDKALQNLALHLEHDFEGFNTDRIEEKRVWKRVCDNCGNTVSTLPCSVCGSDSCLRKRD